MVGTGKKMSSAGAEMNFIPLEELDVGEISADSELRGCSLFGDRGPAAGAWPYFVRTPGDCDGLA